MCESETPIRLLTYCLVSVQIACVSPSNFNSAETMNTLRYATRAKRMKTKPVVIMVAQLTC